MKKKTLLKVAHGFALSVILSVSAYAGLNKLTIPVIESKGQAPVIDGNFVEKEWCRAVALKGLVGMDTNYLSQRQVSVYFIADEQSLYIAMVSPHVPQGTMPEGIKHDRDKISFQEDRVEIKIIPPEHGKHGTFYFIGNSQGSVYDEIVDPKSNKKIISWNGDWIFKNSFDKDNWYLELKIDFKEFGINKISSSEKWRLNFSKAWTFHNQYTGLRKQPHDSFEVTFAKCAPAIQIESLGNLPKGELDLRITAREYEGAVNVPKEAAYDCTPVESETTRQVKNGKQVRILCDIENSSGKRIFSGEKIIQLSPGKKENTELKKDFTPEKQNSFSMRIFEPSSGLLLYEGKIPFTIYNSKEERYYQERLTRGTVLNSWRQKAAFFPYWQKAKISAEFFEGSLKNNAKHVSTTISSDKGFKKTIEVPVTDGKCESQDVIIPGLPAGTYKICSEVLDNNGKVISRKETIYKREVFPWEHNSLGKKRIVIKPWTSMKIKSENEISMWGRIYKLNSLGLPESVISKGKEILYKPAHITLKTNNEEFTVRPEGKLKITENTDDRIKWVGFGEVNGILKVMLEGYAEYDGFMYWHIHLEPKTIPLKIDKLSLVIPVRQKVAQLMHFQASGSRNNFSGAIPNGKGIVYDSLKQRSHLPSGFIPHIWIGNPIRGLSWYSNSDEGWVSAPQKPAIEIARSNDSVIIQLNVINRPFDLKKDRVFEMGVMATPVKPLIPIKNIKTRGVNWLLGKDNRLLQPHQYAPYPESFDYKAIGKGLKEQAKIWKCDAVRLYFNKIELGAALPEWEVFKNEWGALEPPQPYPASIKRFGYEKGLAIQASLTESKIDMLVYYISQLAKKTSMAGTYWDISGIYPGMPMLENKTAYINDEGKLVRTYDLLHSRELFKRVATMWQSIRGEPDYMEIHSTNHIGIPFYSFGYKLLNFEWLWPNERFLREDGKWKDFIDLRPLDLFATEGIPSQFGLWISSINHGQRPKDPKEKRRIERSALALGGLHNHFTGPSPTIGERNELEFIGYWDEDERIKTNHDKYKASMWFKDKEIELIAVNLSLDDLRKDVTIDLKKLGIRSIKKITDLESGASISIDKLNPVDGQAVITLDVPSHDFRLIKIQGE